MLTSDFLAHRAHRSGTGRSVLDFFSTQKISTIRGRVVATEDEKRKGRKKQTEKRQARVPNATLWEC